MLLISTCQWQLPAVPSKKLSSEHKLATPASKPLKDALRQRCACESNASRGGRAAGAGRRLESYLRLRLRLRPPNKLCGEQFKNSVSYNSVSVCTLHGLRPLGQRREERSLLLSARTCRLDLNEVVAAVANALAQEQSSSIAQCTMSERERRARV